MPKTYGPGTLEKKRLANRNARCLFLSPGQISSVGNNIPGEGHGDVFVAQQPVPVIPKVIPEKTMN
jgi:hypothetical protein